MLVKSTCKLEVDFFPWDQQSCRLKLGSWSYDTSQVGGINNHMPSMVRDEITYPFPNFNGCTVDVWE